MIYLCGFRHALAKDFKFDVAQRGVELFGRERALY